MCLNLWYFTYKWWRFSTSKKSQMNEKRRDSFKWFCSINFSRYIITPGVTGRQGMPNSLFCIAYRRYEIDHCSVIFTFHDNMLSTCMSSFGQAHLIHFFLQFLWHTLAIRIVISNIDEQFCRLTDTKWKMGFITSTHLCGKQGHGALRNAFCTGNSKQLAVSGRMELLEFIQHIFPIQTLDSTSDTW